MRFLVYALICILTSPLTSQNITKESDLLFYGDVMINAFEAENRVRAGKQFHKLFQDYASTYDLKHIEEQAFAKFMKIIELEDQAGVIVSWHVKGNDGEYDFKAFYEDSSGKITEFTRTETMSTDLCFTTSSTSEWYGAIYTNSLKLDDNKFLLFGFDLTGEYDNQKIVDVLTIDKDGQLELGAPIFEDKESPGTFLNRLVISYSSDATVTLKYIPSLDIIMQDHLEPRMGLQAGQGVTNIPDGTYEGYALENGKWMYKEKIYDHVYEEVPRPKPVQFDRPEKKDK